jgi:hypothetical protein
MPVPKVPRFALLNVRAIVEHFVLPITSALRAPLWAYVPPEQRGKPDFFVSHTWNSLLLGPPQQEIGTLDAIEHLDHFAWIDFVAYNQHTIDTIFGSGLCQIWAPPLLVEFSHVDFRPLTHCPVKIFWTRSQKRMLTAGSPMSPIRRLINQVSTGET